LDIPGGAARKVLVTVSEPAFGPLVSALSAPNAPPTTGACPAIGVVPQVVLARASAGVYRVAIPVDSWGLYQTAASEALSRARATP
jgi:hypothetical protein